MNEAWTAAQSLSSGATGAALSIVRQTAGRRAGGSLARIRNHVVAFLDEEKGKIALSYIPGFSIAFDMDDDSRRRELAKALEYWALTAFVAGSMIYGIIIGVTDLVLSAH